MEYTTLAPLSPASPADFRASFRELKSAFQSLTDPRRETKNKHYPLWAMLMATLAALLSAQTSQQAVAEWLSAQTEATKQALGFEDGITPHQSTFQRLFAKLKVAQLEIALSGYFDPKVAGELKARGNELVSIDGKCLRGKLKFETEQGVPVHLLSLFSQTTGVVLAQRVVERAKSELSSAPSLIAQINWQGRVLSGDAAFCYENLCKQVVQAGGDYFFVVKGNQPTLQSEAELVFDTNLLPKGLTFDLRYYKEVDKGHGRIEIRQACASRELGLMQYWPYLAQVVHLERQWLEKGQTYSYQTYAITSLPISVADVAELAAYKRKHWGIENRLHWVRDVVFGEDASLIRTGEGPFVMAALRNTALGLLRRAGHSKIRARMRYNACKVEEVLKLLALPA